MINIKSLIKNNKLKIVLLLATFSLSIMLIVSGSVINCNNRPYIPPEGYKNIELEHTEILTADYNNYSFEFKPTSSGYYYVYLDGAKVTNLTENSVVKQIGTYTTTVYANNYTYDYRYKIYLYSNKTYLFTTNALKGNSLRIYIEEY